MRSKLSGCLQISIVWCATMIVGAVTHDATARAQGAATTGCLSNGSCGSVIKNKPNDVWHNYVCLDCHTGTRPAALRLSPQETALLKDAAKFWTTHDQAARDPGVRAAAKERATVKTTLSPEMVRLIALKPGRKK